MSFLRDLWRSRGRVVPANVVAQMQEEDRQTQAKLRGMLDDRKHVLAELDAYLRVFPGTGDKRRAITEELRKKIARVAS